MATAEQLTPNLQYIVYFQDRIMRGLEYWRDHPAIRELKVAILDGERETILTVIGLGLEFPPAWLLVKQLIVALTPYMERRGHWDGWHGVLQKAIAAAQCAGDVGSEITLTALLARLSQRMSRPADVVTYYRRAMRLARQTGNRFEEARTCSNLGYLYIDSGHWWRSEVLSLHALAIFDDLGNTHGQAHTHNHLGVLYTRQKMWCKAEEHLLTAHRIWNYMQDMHGLMRIQGNLGRLYNEMDRPLDAVTHAQLALTYASLTGEESISGTFLMTIAVGYMKQGNMEMACQYANDAEATLLKFSDELQLAYVWHQRSLFYLHTGHLSAAERDKRQALIVYRKFHLYSDESRLLQDFIRIQSLFYRSPEKFCLIGSAGDEVQNFSGELN
jgi:tetratricopeptide (TPR) repeat protein